ncbi:MAG: anthranilate synthase component I family protein [Bacteroidia bacterium]|nr:anthranilate synthase component I family protein [Bacteroidia bacterium]
MIKTQIVFDDLLLIKRKIYALSKLFDVFQICDSNNYATALNIGQYELIAGFGNIKSLSNNLIDLTNELESMPLWKFGLIKYPQNASNLFGDTEFFIPQWVFIIQKDSNVLEIIAQNSDQLELNTFIESFKLLKGDFNPPQCFPDFKFSSKTNREKYIQTVEQIREDIRHGKYYEMNYCIEFSSFWSGNNLLPYMWKLNERTAAPFSLYARLNDDEILCSSPERFVWKNQNKLVSQPIKGTNKLLNGALNDIQMQDLKSNEKERAENVMIVDLVRNDLARVCQAGSIRVDELFGTYPFKTLNHMISTVSGTLEPQSHLIDILSSLFPMGSMTGAPKLEVMRHIQKYEDTNRDIYSGCMGFVDPNGDFDFNVMIRSLVYNKTNKSISYKVGSAITFDSVAELEYEECLLKGHRLEDLFNI